MIVLYPRQSKACNFFRPHIVYRMLHVGLHTYTSASTILKGHSHCAPYGADFAALIAPVSISLFDAALRGAVRRAV